MTSYIFSVGVSLSIIYLVLRVFKNLYDSGVPKESFYVPDLLPITYTSRLHIFLHSYNLNLVMLRLCGRGYWLPGDGRLAPSLCSTFFQGLAVGLQYCNPKEAII